MSRTEGRLSGKVAIVTGSASGVGRATARLFARHGAKVVVNTDRRLELGRETVSMIEDAGGEAIFVQGDVSIGEDVRKLVETACNHFGRLDILVNNAAVIHPNRIVEMPESDWDRTIDVVLKAFFWGAKFAIPAMIDGGGGAIVSISSVNSGLVSNPSWPAYVASKGGLNALTRQLAVDYGPRGIRVNAILPGSLTGEDYENPPGRQTIDARHKVDSYPVGRIGHPLDIAYAALFLASDEAAFVNGALLVVDGGLTSQTPEALVLPSTRRRWGKLDVLLFSDEIDISEPDEE